MVPVLTRVIRRSWRWSAAAAGGLLLTAASVLAQPPAGAAPDGFVPISQLPPAHRMPAAPLLIAAYAFVWVALLVYLWTIWRRLGRVEGELKQIEKQ